MSAGLPAVHHIVHVNVCAFMAVAEALAKPELRGQPFVVGKEGISRGRILDVSPEAYQAGVRPGMDLARADALCPGVSTVEPSYAFYRALDARLEAICRKFTPLVESVPGGHVFLDIGGTRLINGEPGECAVRIREEIREKMGVDASVCLAPTKLTAKVGTRLLRPSGFLIVPSGEDRDFLSHQDVMLLPGIGYHLARYIRALGISEIGTIGELGSAEAASLFGPTGPKLRDRARGVDDDPVLPETAVIPRIFGERVCDGDTNDPHYIRAMAVLLVGELAYTLRSRGLGARRMELELDYSDGYLYRDGITLPGPRYLDRDLGSAMEALLSKSRRIRIRRLGLGLSDFSRVRLQMELFMPPKEARLVKLQDAMDRNRGRYGMNALLPCAALIAVPLTAPTIKSRGVGVPGTAVGGK